MLKIAHIAKPVGGVGVYLNLAAKYLDKNKFEQILLYNKEEKFNEELFQQAFNIPIIREIKILKDFKCLLKIIRLLKEHKPDRIHCHSAKAGILGRIAGAYLSIPTFYTPHAYSYLSAETPIKRYFYKQIERYFKFLPAKTIACSQSEYNRTINDLKFRKGKVLLWKNSIEGISTTEPKEISQVLPKNYICSIGRPSFQKNTELLVRTILEVKKTINDIHLLILGVGFYSPTQNRIKKLIKTHNLDSNITLVSWLDRDESISILKNSLLYISTSRYEGLPYAILEALALAKPSIVTDVDGNNELVKDNYNGFLVGQNSEEIAEKIIQLLDNAKLRKRMGKNSKNLFEKNYIIENNISKLEKIYFE